MLHSNKGKYIFDCINDNDMVLSKSVKTKFSYIHHEFPFLIESEKKIQILRYNSNLYCFKSI